MVESGWFYGNFIDPVLENMRRRIAGKIKPGEAVIDIACGTGAQVFAFSSVASKAVGVDLSESMIAWAEEKASKNGFSNTRFYVSDAANLTQFEENEFDVATMSLALHQFETNLHSTLLAEMKRIAGRIILFDYAVPLPKNYVGFGSRIAEFFAGREHYTNFKEYYARGGLNQILPQNELVIEESNFYGKDAFQLTVCSVNGSR